MRDNNRFLGIIPARYASTRFPGKPLVDMMGKSMIQRVYEAVEGCFDATVVATDDQRIYDAVVAFGGRAVMTSVDHQSGTDRCREAMELVGGDYDVVINVQGDEPFVAQQQITQLKGCFECDDAEIATLVIPFATMEQVESPNSPKVLLDPSGRAIYFSRSVIPYLRGVDRSQWLDHHTYYKHIGLYGYRAEVLRRITTLAPSLLEQAESLEQLRWLEHGYTINVAVTDIESLGIDTPADMAAALERLASVASD